jgi:hypothetical protein
MIILMKKIVLLSILFLGISAIGIFAHGAYLGGDGNQVRSAIATRIATLARQDPIALGEISRKIPLLLTSFADNPADKALLFFIQKEIDLALTPVSDDDVHPWIIEAWAEQFE